MRFRDFTCMSVFFAALFLFVSYVTAQLKSTALPSLIRSSNANNQLSVENFLYQLDNKNLTAVGNTAFEMVIMDYSSDGEVTGEFSAAQIET